MLVAAFLFAFMPRPYDIPWNFDPMSRRAAPTKWNPWINTPVYWEQFTC